MAQRFRGWNHIFSGAALSIGGIVAGIAFRGSFKSKAVDRADSDQLRSKPASNAGTNPRTRDRCDPHFEGLRSLALLLPRRQVDDTTV
jgi:hypothetical protein